MKISQFTKKLGTTNAKICKDLGYSRQWLYQQLNLMDVSVKCKERTKNTLKVYLKEQRDLEIEKINKKLEERLSIIDHMYDEENDKKDE